MALKPLKSWLNDPLKVLFVSVMTRMYATGTLVGASVYKPFSKPPVTVMFRS